MALTSSSLGTPEQLKDPDYTPPLASAIPLGIQHVPQTARVLLTSGLLPAAFIAIFLNLVLPQDLPAD